ncbi:hypothetical protein JHK85_001515 [Glycine max]|nr:hypothetical protein JHK85_001515 [Glycine max]
MLHISNSLRAPFSWTAHECGFVKSRKSKVQHEIHKIYSHIIKTPPCKSETQHGVHETTYAMNEQTVSLHSPLNKNQREEEEASTSFMSTCVGKGKFPYCGVWRACGRDVVDEVAAVGAKVVETETGNKAKDNDSDDNVDFVARNVKLITTKEVWDQYLEEARRDGKIRYSEMYHKDTFA